MTQKKRAADPERKAALTKPDQRKGCPNNIKNAIKKLSKENVVYHFYFKNGCIQYKKK